MTLALLEGLFEAVARPVGENPDKPIYSVMPISGYGNYFIGKDREGHACLLIATSEPIGGLASPIRLENLDVQFELRCHLRRSNEAERTGIFTVIRCRTLDGEIVRYFLSVCETIVGILGEKPKQREVASAVHRLAAIFQKMQKPPTRPVKGLMGELYLIWRSSSPSRAMTAWRVDEAARFDFGDDNIRIDVKATTGRLRAHIFSYEQCTPPAGTVAVVGSLFVEQSPGGMALRSLIAQIEATIAAYPDLVLKLHEVVTATLGSNLGEALAMAFDSKLADSSFRFYSLRDIPAVRGLLPEGVSDVHFRSDLSSVPPLSAQQLIEQDPAFESFLPREGL